MAATATGRLSSEAPNLQNIPTATKEGTNIRRAFQASGDRVLLSADYSQVELRLLAHVAGVKTLQNAFNNGIDIHRQTASQVFGVPVEEVTSEQRSRAKAINFGIIYGQSATGQPPRARRPETAARPPPPPPPVAADVQRGQGWGAGCRSP
jgi:DNA polymerase-1